MLISLSKLDKEALSPNYKGFKARYNLLTVLQLTKKLNINVFHR